jgi:hypothetical protein
MDGATTGSTSSSRSSGLSAPAAAPRRKQPRRWDYTLEVDFCPVHPTVKVRKVKLRAGERLTPCWECLEVSSCFLEDYYKVG